MVQSIHHSIIMKALSEYDEVRHIPALVDLTLMGEDYKVNDIRYLVKNEAQPLIDYVCFKEYDDDFLLVYCHSRDEELLEAMAVTIQNSDFGEKEIRTPYPEIFTSPILAERFTMTASGENISPIYALTDLQKLPSSVLPFGVTVELWDRSDAETVIMAMPELGDGAVWVCENYRDTRHYLLRKDGIPVGLLRAECAYKNYYDIGWLHIEPSYRSQGLGTCLVLAFAHDCLAIGGIPHYGFAINAESARVAEKCGFENVREQVAAVQVENLTNIHM